LLDGYPNNLNEYTKKVNKLIRSFGLNLEKAEEQFYKKNEIDYEKNIANASDELKKIIELGAINVALELEISWYKLVKRRETERNYYLAFRNHANSFFNECFKRRISFLSITFSTTMKPSLFIAVFKRLREGIF